MISSCINLSSFDSLKKISVAYSALLQWKLVTDSTRNLSLNPASILFYYNSLFSYSHTLVKLDCHILLSAANRGFFKKHFKSQECQYTVWSVNCIKVPCSYFPPYCLTSPGKPLNICKLCFVTLIIPIFNALVSQKLRQTVVVQQ